KHEATSSECGLLDEHEQAENDALAPFAGQLLVEFHGVRHHGIRQQPRAGVEDAIQRHERVQQPRFRPENDQWQQAHESVESDGPTAGSPLSGLARQVGPYWRTEYSADGADWIQGAYHARPRMQGLRDEVHERAAEDGITEIHEQEAQRDLGKR